MTTLLGTPSWCCVRHVGKTVGMPSLRWLRRSRRKWLRRRKLAWARFVKARRIVRKRNRQIDRAKSGPGAMARWGRAQYGRTENNNRAPWLDAWARQIGEWMVGQPWCGLYVWKAALAAGKRLDPRVVSTVYIRQAAMAGTGGFRAWHPASATPKIGWVAVYGTGGPVHTGFYVGDGIVAEGNTSPGSGGSQNNGGGCYPRKLSERRGWLLGWAEIDW